jgi:putative SOS response-associated peptidase YedK
MGNMCSRYEMDGTRDAVVLRFGLLSAPEFPPLPELRPTDAAPVIVAPGRAELLAWGLDVAWSRGPLINARAETLAEKKTFREILKQRCLIPASAYFEWRAEGSRRVKTRVARKDAALFAFAGLRGGGRFTIVTCPPAPEIAHVHDRMPVVLEAETEAAWLDTGLPFAALGDLLVPLAGGVLACTDAQPTPRQGELFG